MSEHNIDRANQFLSYMTGNLPAHITNTWGPLFDEARGCLARADADALYQISIKDHAACEPWAVALTCGYCLCCLGDIERGLELLARAYKLDQSPLTLERVYELGLDHHRYDVISPIASEDLGREQPIMPRESTLVAAWALRDQEQYAEAQQLYADLLEQFPNDTEISLQYAGCLIIEGYYYEALAIYEGLDAEYPDDAKEILHSTAFCLVSMLDPSAERFIKDALAKDPGDDYLNELMDALQGGEG